eukprot:g14738.t1
MSLEDLEMVRKHLQDVFVKTTELFSWRGGNAHRAQRDSILRGLQENLDKFDYACDAVLLYTQSYVAQLDAAGEKPRPTKRRRTLQTDSAEDTGHTLGDVLLQLEDDGQTYEQLKQLFFPDGLPPETLESKPLSPSDPQLSQIVAPKRQHSATHPPLQASNPQGSPSSLQRVPGAAGPHALAQMPPNSPQPPISPMLQASPPTLQNIASPQNLQNLTLVSPQNMSLPSGMQHMFSPHGPYDTAGVLAPPPNMNTGAGSDLRNVIDLSST